MSNQFDHLDDSEREWLRASRRSAARRSWLLIGILVVIALFLAWLTVDGLPRLTREPTTTTNADQRAIADGEQALTDWGEFAVTNDLDTVKDTFWANGPQYQQLEREAKQRTGEPIGPPPYKMTMTGVQVLKPRDDQRVLRGRVQMTRPGEKPQSFNWDVWLQADPAAGGRWRLWTVRDTAGGS
ncbi:MAG TPA: hypothetical protein VHM23_27440 [Actinomycetota bacterium]|nr:hypothetical protein [Actinomycetota bacterium]